MTIKSKTKKATPRKRNATKQAGESLVLQRTAQARQYAEYTLDEGAGFDYELAARITLLLTDDATPDTTLEAIRRAIICLAATTGINAAYPTVVCETIPAMLAAIASGETFNFENETAEGNRAELLALVARAEAGEVLPAPAEATSQRAEFPMKPIDDDEARELADYITGGADDYDRERKYLVRLVCGIAGIKDEQRRHEAAADAVHAVFLNLTNIYAEVGHFVERLYAEDKQKGGAK
jgi:hypothetical protein